MCQFDYRHSIKRKKSLSPGASRTNTSAVFIVPVFRGKYIWSSWDWNMVRLTQQQQTENTNAAQN